MQPPHAQKTVQKQENVSYHGQYEVYAVGSQAEINRPQDGIYAMNDECKDGGEEPNGNPGPLAIMRDLRIPDGKALDNKRIQVEVEHEHRSARDLVGYPVMGSQHDAVVLCGCLDENRGDTAE